MTNQTLPGSALPRYLFNRIQPNPWQTRLSENPEHIRQLANDIAENDLMSPPVMRIHPDNPEEYQLAFGHSRLAAYRLLYQEALVAGDDNAASRWARMPAEVRSLTDQEMAEYAIRENAQRHDLTAIEKAKALQRYIADFHATQEQAGALFGLGQSAVANLLRLLRLPESVQVLVQDGRLPERFARQILAVEKLPAAETEKIAVRVAEAPLQDREELVAEAVQKAVGRNCERIDDELFPPSWFDMSADIPDCGPCPARIAQRNQDERCANPPCFVRKLTAWRDLRLAQLPAETGIPAAAPGEAVKAIDATMLEYSDGDALLATIKKKAIYLRWMVEPKNYAIAYGARHEIFEITRTQAVVLGVTDRAAWETWRDADRKRRHVTHRLAASGEDTPAAKAARKREEREERRKKAEANRRLADAGYVARQGVAALAKRIPAKGAFLALLSDHMAADIDDDGLDLDLLDRAGLGKKASSPVSEEEKRQLIAAALFQRETGRHWSSADNRILIDHQRAIRSLAAALKASLPTGWNKPPIHHTAVNCWTCGRFSPAQQGALTEQDRSEGWVEDRHAGHIGSVTCPDCVKKAAKKSTKSKKK